MKITKKVLLCLFLILLSSNLFAQNEINDGNRTFKPPVPGDCFLTYHNLFKIETATRKHRPIVKLDEAMKNPSCPKLEDYTKVVEAYRQIPNSFGGISVCLIKAYSIRKGCSAIVSLTTNEVIDPNQNVLQCQEAARQYSLSAKRKIISEKSYAYLHQCPGGGGSWWTDHYLGEILILNN